MKSNFCNRTNYTSGMQCTESDEHDERETAILDQVNFLILSLHGHKI